MFKANGQVQRFPETAFELTKPIFIMDFVCDITVFILSDSSFDLYPKVFLRLLNSQKPCMGNCILWDHPFSTYAKFSEKLANC